MSVLSARYARKEGLGSEVLKEINPKLIRVEFRDMGRLDHQAKFAV